MIGLLLLVIGVIALPAGLFALYRYADRADREVRATQSRPVPQQTYEEPVTIDEQEYLRMLLQAELNAQALARYARDVRS